MSQIPCKQSTRIEMTGWFKHYFPGNLRRNFLFTVCNYTSYQSLQKTSLPKPCSSFEIKSNLHYARGVTPKRVASGGAHLRGLAPGLHSSEKTSQRWRAVGDTVPI